MKDYTYIGKSTPMVDAKYKVTGTASYSSDIYLPGMHYGKCKRSPHPFAKILSIDITKALNLPGVSAVITSRNIKPVSLWRICRRSISALFGFHPLYR